MCLAQRHVWYVCNYLLSNIFSFFNSIVHNVPVVTHTRYMVQPSYPTITTAGRLPSIICKGDSIHRHGNGEHTGLITRLWGEWVLSVQWESSVDDDVSDTNQCDEDEGHDLQ